MVFDLTWVDHRPGKSATGKISTGPYIRIELSMVNDMAIRKTCAAILKEIPKMQMRNVIESFQVVKKYALKIIRTGEGMVANRGQYAIQKREGGPISGYSAYFSPDTSFLYGDRENVSIDYSIPYPYKQSWKARYIEFAVPSTRVHALGILSGELYNGVKQTELKSSNVSQTDTYIKAGPKGGITGAHRKRNVEVDTKLSVTFTKPDYIGHVHNGKAGVPPRPFFKMATVKTEQKVAAILRKNLRLFSFTKLYRDEGDITTPNHQLSARLDTARVYPYWTFEQTDSMLSDMEIDYAYSNARKASPRKKSVKASRPQTAYERSKETFRELMGGNNEWEDLKKKARGRWL